MSSRRAVLALLLSVALVAEAAEPSFVERLLAQAEPPPGVVFEVVTGDEHGLEWALPQIAADVRRLRERFPGLAVAVVSHGREMFALRRDRRDAMAAVHAGLERLTREEAIPVHVCGTYAAWRGVPEEAFSDDVNVAPEGPAQIQAYEALGYVRVRLARPASPGSVPLRVK